MAKYNKKRVNHICNLLSKDSYTIEEICSLSGISKETYYTWIETKPDFVDSINRAKADYDDMIVKEAKKSLVKKIKGYTVKEEKIVYIDSGKTDTEGKSKPKIKEKTVIDKTFQPDTVAIIFTLTNKAPDEFKNRQSSELTGKDGKDLIPARVLTKKEAQEYLSKLENEY